MVFYVIFLALKKIAKIVTQSCAENCLTRWLRKPSNQGVVTVRFLLEACIEIGLSCMISILSIEKDTFMNAWEVISMLLAVVSLVGLMIAPIQLRRLSLRLLAMLD